MVTLRFKTPLVVRVASATSAFGLLTGPALAAESAATTAASTPPSETASVETESAPQSARSKAAAPEANSEAPQQAQSDRSREATLHHGAPASASKRKALVLLASIDHPQRIEHAVAFFKTSQYGEWVEREFRLDSQSEYRVRIEPEEFESDELYYGIELIGLDGTRTPVFASRQAPHVVALIPDHMQRRELALAHRLNQKRAVFFGSGEYVDFGASDWTTVDSQGGTATNSVRDRYWRSEGGFSYRPLGTVTEFAVRIGVIRGKSPVPLDESSTTGGGASRLDVGLNYAEPSVLFRFADSLHFEGSFLTSVTEVGFSVGAGAALHVGDPYGTKLVLGGETIQVFGSRFYSRLDLYPTRRLRVSPTVEVTNMPHADRAGLRLLGAVGYDLGQGFAVSVLGGYQARKFTSGGPSAGLGVAYAF